MIVANTRRVTLDEYKALPEGPPYFEFEQGELIPVPSPTPRHQEIVAELMHLLRRHVREHNLGRVFMEVDVYLPDGEVYIPDLSYVSANRLGLLRAEDQKVHGAPDLAVEVTSSDPGRDRVHKLQVYHANGVAWYWIVDSTTLDAEEYRATPDGYLRTASAQGGDEFRPKVFEGLAINLQALVGEAKPPAPEPERPTSAP